MSEKLTDLVSQDCVSESVTVSHIQLVDKSVSQPETISEPINQYKQSISQHMCHISHCEIKSYRIWLIWKPVPIKFSNLTEFSDHLTTHFMKK